MPDFHVIRHEIRQVVTHGGEEPIPGSDALTIFHKNPLDPDDPVEFGHTIRLQGLAHRKEMWGLAEYADVIDMELRDLERYYCRSSEVEYGPHPTGNVTGHYFTAPAEHMRTFAPEYVMERVMQSVRPATKEGAMRLCADVALSGLGDVRGCLRNSEKQTFRCRSMTGLSIDSVKVRSSAMGLIDEQTQQISLTSSSPLDAVRQLVTDRASEMDFVRDAFVSHALMEASVPEIMRRRAVTVAIKQGFL